MAIPVKIEAFEGPLDLLLHLIEKNKVSIYDIPIVEITAQYMEYIRQMEGENLGVMSEFLVMAATLLDIKSRMLLPKEVDEETGEEVDPRAELVEQLLEYKLYKHMADDLKMREEENAGAVFRKEMLPKEVAFYREPADLDKLLSGITLNRLNMVFEQVMKRREDRLDPIRSTFGTIEREKVSLKETREGVSGFIRTRKNCTFRELLTARPGRMYTVAAFLTILELMKTGCIRVVQEETFSEIYIVAEEGECWDQFEEETDQAAEE